MPTFFKRHLINKDDRMFRRARSFCLIKYSRSNDPAHKKTLVNPRNISADGVMFISDTNFTAGTMLDMDIYLPPLKNFFTVIGNIIKSSKIKGVNQYLVRLHFKAMNPDDKKHINTYIEQLAKNPLISRYIDKKTTNFKRRHIY